ncbi:MAG: hypothetical protein JNJ85_16770 [Candidatus Kapabacteria bacterium]|nr:hypothetical protein [Candidatus Kapabacteria bacterium]
MKLKFVLYCTALFCTVVSLSRAGTWDTLYTRQTGLTYPSVMFAPDDSFVLVSGLDESTNTGITQLYRPSDGVLLGKQPFYFISFSHDGKSALVNINEKRQLVDWKNNWQIIVEFEKDLNIHDYQILYDNKGMIGTRGNGYALWDGETGKIRKDIQLHEDTIVSGSGQNRVVKTYGIKSVALLADGKTLCVSEVVEVYNYGIQKKVSEEYIGEVIDIETGERKAVAKDIYRFIAIPGSNDVIGVGKRDSTKSYFDCFYLYNGNTLLKQFMYNIPWGDHALESISFNNTQNTFFYSSYTLTGIVEVNTGKILTSINEEVGFPTSLSSNNKYVAVSGLAMYEFNKLFSITDALFNENVKNQTLPQPSTGILKINNTDIRVDISCNIKVFTAKGSEVPSVINIISQQEGSIILDVSSLPNGQYTLTLQQVDKVFSYPFILTK